MDWNQIKAHVENNGDVSTFAMEVLRDAHGAGKLGVNVRDEISQKLAGMGLGHVPADLPSAQHDQVRLYKKGTPVGLLIDAALAPGEQHDKDLVGRVAKVTTGPNYAAIVEKIRGLVAE